MRRGMVIDLKRCIGCYACQLSCNAEYGTPPGVFYARVLKHLIAADQRAVLAWAPD